MAGTFAWGWDSDNEKWIPILVDSTGRVRIVAEIDHLDDIGDVNVTGPTDGFILYWDEGEGEYKLKEIPGAAWGDITGKPDSPTLEELATEHEDDGTHENITPTSCTLQYTDAAAVAAAEAAGLALASSKNIKVIQALTDDHTGSGLTAIMTAGENLLLGHSVYVKNDGKMWKSDADGAATMPIIAMATANIAADAEGEFLLLGFFRDDSWTYTPGGLLYASVVAGFFGHITGDGSGSQVQVVGVAITADIILFNPSFELVEIA